MWIYQQTYTNLDNINDSNDVDVPTNLDKEAGITKNNSDVVLR
jgi:hypothetical protein